MPYIFDCEGDGINPTKIYCVVVNSFEKIYSLTSYEEMRKFFIKADVLIGHNIIRWDIPQLEKILNIKIKAKLIDTLALSWYLFPKKVKHGLEEWGEELGVDKPEINDWFNLSLEEYVHRCTEDVKINTLLWDKEFSYLKDIYKNEEDLYNLIYYLTFKLLCAQEQIKSGWKLDIEKTKKYIGILSEEALKKYNLLKGIMPKIPVYKEFSRPSKPFKKNGSYSIQGQKWFDKLKEKNYPSDFNGTIKEIISYEEPNPNSNDQLKNWLYKLGWVPDTFKYVRNKETNEFKKIEQIQESNSNNEHVLTPSVIKLFNKEPRLQSLEGLCVLNHRINILKGFLDNVNDQGYIKAEISGFTNTLRFKHKICVNLPGVDKPYGDIIRGVLIAPEGYELCGADQASLEDRTKQHYMCDYDKDYVNEMNVKGFDPHLDIALIAHMMTQEEVDAYKNGDHSKKSIRHNAKQVNYSCTYGVTPKGLVRNTGMSLKEAKILHAAYWKRNWSLKSIANNCKVKTVNGQDWLYNPLSHIWLSLRNDKDKFSTLNQSTATYCFDTWIKYIFKKRKQLTAQFHDEVVLCIKKDHREQAKKILLWAEEEMNKELKLNRKLDIDVQFGDNYAEIH